MESSEANGEHQPAVVGAQLRGVGTQTIEQVERALEQRAARHGDGEALHVRSSPVSAMWSRSTFNANPTAGSGRPKRPSRSS